MKKRFFGFLVLWLAVPAAAGAGIMLLWNLLFPAIFGLTVISYWQGLGLFLLCQLLCGGFIFGLIGMAMMFGHHHAADGHRAIHDHWHNMSREERREFINRRMGFRGPSFGGGVDGTAESGMDAKRCGADGEAR